MRLALILFMTLSNTLFAYTPSLESLLRNGSNIDIGKNTVYANLIIRQLDPENGKTIVEGEEVRKEVIKILIFNEYENYPKLCQVNYKGGVLNNNSLLNWNQLEISALNGRFANVENSSAELFYGVMTYLLNNESKVLFNFLKKYGNNVNDNSSLVNKEKLRLLSSYKFFVSKVGDEESSELKNPLNPENDELKERVEEIMARPFLDKDSIVKRVRENDQFYWVVNDSHFHLKFDNEHQIRNLKVQTNIGEYKMVFGAYSEFGAGLKFPEFIWFYDVNGNKYEVKASKYTMFQDSDTAHRNRLKRYTKHMEENKLDPPSFRFNFLL